MILKCKKVLNLDVKWVLITVIREAVQVLIK